MQESLFTEAFEQAFESGDHGELGGIPGLPWRKRHFGGFEGVAGRK